MPKTFAILVGIIHPFGETNWCFQGLYIGQTKSNEISLHDISLITFLNVSGLYLSPPHFATTTPLNKGTYTMSCDKMTRSIILISLLGYITVFNFLWPLMISKIYEKFNKNFTVTANTIKFLVICNVQIWNNCWMWSRFK